MNAAHRKPPGGRTIGKTRLFFLTAVAALLTLCFAYPRLTHRVAANQANPSSQKHAKNKGTKQTGDQSTVNTTPWQTAQALAAAAATPQEAKYARQAEQLADHEVDQAFDTALRCAELKMSPNGVADTLCAKFKMREETPTNKMELARDTQRVEQLQQDIAQEKRTIKHLNTEAGKDHASTDPAADDNNLKFVQFQLGIDKDELTDAQRDLNRAMGDATLTVENEFETYQTSTHTFDQQEASNTPLPLHRVHNPGTLLGLLHIWFSQRGRIAALTTAHDDTCSHLKELKGNLTNTNCAEPNTQASTPAAVPAVLSTSTSTSDPTSPAGNSQISASDQNTLHRLGLIHKDRIHTNDQLAGIYASWIGQVQRQHSFIQNRVLQSIGAILAVILWMLLCDAILHRLTDHPAFARRKMQTLRAVFRVGIQLVGIFVILLFIFGPPNETGTIIGLITAALALALQDYILAFFGWFMLAGPNGISVGDMVEIDGVCGEVVDVGLMRTTLLETTGLQEKGEPTGRRVSLLNSFAVHGTCFNFSTEGQWLWDEITITVPANSDIYTIAKSVEGVAVKETATSARLAEQDWNQKMPSTSLNRISAAPIVMMRPSISLDASTGIDIQVRYVTHAVGRAEVRDRLYKHVIRMLKQQNHLDPPPAAAPALP